MLRAAFSALFLGVALITVSAGPPRGTHFRQTPTAPSVALLKALGAAQRSLVTDLVWIRAIAVSAKMRDPADGKALIEWCRVVAALDPRFPWSYLVGGLLGQMTYDGKNYNVKEAAAMLEQGMRALPDDHRFAMYLAYNQLMLQKDALAAAATLQRGSSAPRAPPYMAQLATRLFAQEGSFDAARAFASALTQSADPETRAFFEYRLLEIARDERLARVRDAVERYSAARLRLPASVQALIDEGFLSGAPLDPLGGTIRVNPETGAVTTDSGEPLRALFPIDP